MPRSELVGYIRKTNGNAIKVMLQKKAIQEELLRSNDDYITLIVSESKLRMILGEQQDVASVVQITDN